MIMATVIHHYDLTLRPPGDLGSELQAGDLSQQAGDKLRREWTSLALGSTVVDRLSAVNGTDNRELAVDMGVR